MIGPDGLRVDAEESAVNVESNESTRCDCCRFPGRNFASPPTDLGEGVGVLSLSPVSAVGVMGVRHSTGARRSSSSSSSSSEESPSSWKSEIPALERTVPIPSVCIGHDEQGAKRRGISIGDSQGERKQRMVSIVLRFRHKYQETPLGAECSEV